MRSTIQTPGVFVIEFPVQEFDVPTAVPAFIGYSEMAKANGADAPLTPVRLRSMAEYEQAFGGAHRELFYLTAEAPAPGDVPAGRVSLGGTATYTLVKQGAARFTLYDSMRLFFANGGGECVVISCGGYQDPISAEAIQAGLDAAAQEAGVTMLVVPEATLLGGEDHAMVVHAMLHQCGALGDRIALLDVPGADAAAWSPDAPEDPVERFREAIGGNPYLRYGIAYFPFLLTDIVGRGEIGLRDFAGDDAAESVLVAALTEAAEAAYPPVNGAPDPRAAGIIENLIGQIGSAAPAFSDAELTEALAANMPGFARLLDHIATRRNILPPSAAMAGLYAAIDDSRGVWKAPANIGFAGRVSPMSNMTDVQQARLAGPADGLSINAIRVFRGLGALVWGARTLDGNREDSRFIQVLRTRIYVEQAIKLALRPFVSQPNGAQTWFDVVGTIKRFLGVLWLRGGLMGASPEDAYAVQAGLGSTMTEDDVLNATLRVRVALCLVRPGEFIELTFEQQMLSDA